MLATMAEAHHEWHNNSGIPMGTPGCPQDACHSQDPEDDTPLIKCLVAGCGVPTTVEHIRAHFADFHSRSLG
jgi:hypothetical protein